MKGILLAGGTGSRLYPVTLGVSKQLLPVYNKPMVYYPLSTLMLAGIREILVITTLQDQPLFQKVLGDGSQMGIKIEFAVQESPGGIAEAFLIGKDFLGDSSCCLILGDNIFYGTGLPLILERAAETAQGALVFGYPVHNPQDYGVVQFDSRGIVTHIEEKPVQPKSNYAVPGIYFYDNRVVQIASEIRPSSRGEKEITDINKFYLSQKNLRVEILSRGIAWLDTGNPDALLKAGMFIETIEKRQGLKIGCPEEIAFRKGWISSQQLSRIADAFSNTEYGRYFHQLVMESGPGIHLNA